MKKDSTCFVWVLRDCLFWEVCNFFCWSPNATKALCFACRTIVVQVPDTSRHQVSPPSNLNDSEKRMNHSAGMNPPHTGDTGGESHAAMDGRSFQNQTEDEVKAVEGIVLLNTTHFPDEIDPNASDARAEIMFHRSQNNLFADDHANLHEKVRKRKRVSLHIQVAAAGRCGVSDSDSVGQRQGWRLECLPCWAICTKTQRSSRLFFWVRKLDAFVYACRVCLQISRCAAVKPVFLTTRINNDFSFDDAFAVKYGAVVRAFDPR